MYRDRDEYDEFYKSDMWDEWMNSAYDENGNVCVCDICGEDFRWDEALRNWQCSGCGQTMSRVQYFNYIGADPPGRECVTECRENYPFCKKYCERFIISQDDPMLT